MQSSHWQSWIQHYSISNQFFFLFWLNVSIADLLKFPPFISKASGLNPDEMDLKTKRYQNHSVYFKNALIHQELTACPRSFVLQKQIKTRFMWRKTWFRFKSCSAPNWLRCNFHWIFINTLSWIKLPTRASSFWKQSANLKWCLDNILSKTE